jgi:hypothetical protein
MIYHIFEVRLSRRGTSRKIQDTPNPNKWTCDKEVGD